MPTIETQTTRRRPRNNRRKNKKNKANNAPGLKQQSVSAPVAKANKITVKRPVIRTSNQSVRVQHTEYLQEVFGSVNYSSTTMVIQPGLQGSFPWLSNMAALYESYTMNKLSYHFKTEKSTATNGTVMMAIDYDVQDPAPPSKQQLMAYVNATRTQPWADATHVSAQQDLQKFKTRYVRTGAIASADYKTFDIGSLFIATQGCADASVLGELYVSYDITFRTPQLDLSGYASAGSNRSNGLTGVTGLLLLGSTTAGLNIAGSGMTITYNTTTGGMTFGTVGSYLFSYTAGTATAATGTVIPSFTGGSQVSAITTAVSATLYVLTFTINVINTTDVLTFAGLTLPSSTGSTLRVASYPYNL